MSLDNAKNFGKVVLSTGYDAVATSVVLTAGGGSLLPTVPFNVAWWNNTDYADPADDPNKEIVRVTNISTDTLTITRAQEGTLASTKNTGGKTYKMIAGLTAKTINTDIPATFQYKSFVTVGTTNADYLIANYTDIGAAINQAYADLSSIGGAIMVLAGTYLFTTPIVFGTNNKFVSLFGFSAASTFLQYTPTSGTAITMNCGNPTGHLTYEIAGFTLMGKTSLVAAAQANTNTSIGIHYGGANGAVGINTHDMNVNGFGSNWEIGSNAYMLSFNNFSNSGGNGGQASRGSLLHINAASNSGERNVFNGGSFTDPGNSLATNAIYITSSGTASNSFAACSFDDVQVFIGASNGQTSFTDTCHFENSAFSTYGQYIPILGVSSDRSTMISLFGTEFANDGNSSGNTFQTLIKHGGQLVTIGTMINNYGGQTITNFVDHSLDNGLASEIIGMTQIQGGGLTNLIAGSGGVPYTQANGATFIHNIANSYSIGLRANGSNTNEFFSGSSTVGSFDHNGNWTLGISGVGGNITTYGTITLGTLSDANITRSASGQISVSGVVVPTISSTNTITNKRITLRVTSTSIPGATPTINTDNCDVVHLTALGTAITSMTTNLTGTPVEGDELRIDFTDDGTGRGITWGAKFEASTVALPTTTVLSTRLDCKFVWNTVTSKWRIVLVA